MAALVDALQREHSDMGRLLDLLVQQIEGAGKLDAGLLHEIMEYCLTYPDQYHHPKEDLIYQALRRHDPEAALAIDDLVAEHEELGVATRELAAVAEQANSGKSPPDGFEKLVRTFVQSYREHVRKEEQEFFPAALAALGPEEWSDLESEIDDPTDPLFHEEAARRFDAIFHGDGT